MAGEDQLIQISPVSTSSAVRSRRETNVEPAALDGDLAHLLRRGRTLCSSDHPRSRAADIHALLKHALRLRDDARVGRLSRDGLAEAVEALAARLARRLTRPGPLADVQRFAAHLTREWTALFNFLRNPAIDATNWRAEQAIRSAVVTRKVCGGNRFAYCCTRTARPRTVEPSAR